MELELRQVGYRQYEGTYRGKFVRVWGEHADGGFRRVQRWWNYEACGHTERHIKDYETARRLAVYAIDCALDGDPRIAWARRWRRFWDDDGEEEPESQNDDVAETQDKTAELYDKLRQMTVARGCTAAEAKIAETKLAALQKRRR